MKYLLFIMLCLSCSSASQNEDLLSNDYKLFENTPVWSLAKAVKDEDMENIIRILHVEKPNINYQESKYGSTLLMMAIRNRQYNSCRVLLEQGADPNIHETYSGSSAIIEAASIQDYNGDNTKFLKLLLKFRANPNDEEVGPRREGNSTRKNPLLVACGDVNQHVSPIEKVKTLVDAGADINFKNEYNMTAIRAALICKHMDVVLYLLQKGADYNQLISSEKGKDFYLVDELKYILFPLNSKEYSDKMKVVEFLKLKGINYRITPVPDYAKSQAKKMYPNNWKKYLEEY
ncbi:MAG TPA: ankyrin repeat domain-containing protein [Pedobacter sp.]|nr:ankyrin repeat domain-containing protein [Pedobacter sp.]